ncbi:MAG: hypothetical protein HUJ91_02450 [Bacteroidales bacterium]|nr:hypothetical protein [Bacteroidales bacterium]
MIYKYRATIPSSKVFVREYEVNAEMNLFEFNNFLNVDLGFAPDQMVMFTGFDESGKMGGRYALFDLGDGPMEKVTFADLVGKGEVIVEFCYDIRLGSVIVLTFEGEVEPQRRAQYPRMVAEKGKNPDQFSGKYEDAVDVLQLGAKPSVPIPEDDDDFDDDDESDSDTEEIYDADESDE